MRASSDRYSDRIVTIPQITATVTSTATPSANALWISPAVPDELRRDAQNSGIPIVNGFIKHPFV